MSGIVNNFLRVNHVNWDVVTNKAVSVDLNPLFINPLEIKSFSPTEFKVTLNEEEKRRFGKDVLEVFSLRCFSTNYFVVSLELENIYF